MTLLNPWSWDSEDWEDCIHGWRFFIPATVTLTSSPVFCSMKPFLVAQSPHISTSISAVSSVWLQLTLPALKHSPVVSQRFVFMESSSSCAGMSWTSPSSVCQTSSQWCICGTWKGTSPYPELWRNVAASMSEGCATVEHIKSWYGQLLLQSSKRMRVLGFVKWLTGSPGTRKGLCNREQLVIVASVTINLEWEEKTKKNRWFLNKCLPSLTLHFSSSFFTVF